MKFTRSLLNLAIISVSTGIGLLLVEFSARHVLNASDYLAVQMVSDDVLGAVPSKSTAAGTFDEWGFRNPRVPEVADIVALGDSHTFGNTATMEDSWPYVLARLSGQRVYNMGLGGYGPNQYFALFTSKALRLKPRTIIVGLYMGDDFENAYLMTYGLAHWAYLREQRLANVDPNIWSIPVSLNWQKRIRNWLAENSLTYQLAVHGPLAARLAGDVRIREAGAADGAVVLDLPDRQILEAFRPSALVSRLDQNSAAVREGMRITFKLLTEMKETCQRKGIRFVVVVIPTKESVFSDEFDNEATRAEAVQQLLANERLARERTFKFFMDSSISYVDVLPALRKSRDKQLYARTATDMHPGRNGYRVIAEAVLARLTSSAEMN